MLIKLNKLNRGMAHFDPPIPVTKNFDDVDRTMYPDAQIEMLLWIPAVLVCRFLHQFPFLKREADELFAIGMLTVVDTVHNSLLPGHKIGAHIHTNACADMEAYCNDLGSAVSIHTRTRYRNRADGKQTPQTMPLWDGDATTTDHDTALIVEDAAEFLGIDLDTADLNDKRRIAKILGVKV